MTSGASAHSTRTTTPNRPGIGGGPATPPAPAAPPGAGGPGTGPGAYPCPGPDPGPYGAPPGGGPKCPGYCPDMRAPELVRTGTEGGASGSAHRTARPGRSGGLPSARCRIGIPPVPRRY
ncbi:hypothetical protein GCM10010519_64360 [Streptomyces lactacystinicus]